MTPRPATPAPPSSSADVPAPLSERLSQPAVPRIVAIGDLHGDLDHARRAFRLAGATDAAGHWSGGGLWVVQTGDEIDRGDDDRAILDWVSDLQREARRAGGNVVALLGNHEIMNASLDFRYVTPGGFAAFSLFTRADAATSPARASTEAGRAAAFSPGGPYAKVLATRPLFARIGDTVFVHGGVLPKHVAYGLDRMNDETDAWLRGDRPAPPAPLVSEDGPIWTREYSADGVGNGEAACSDLETALARLGAARMVVGHTVQPRGITRACDDHVWRIDVGLSHAFGGPVEALEIAGNRVKVLHEAP